MDRELQDALQYARELATTHPTRVTRAPIGYYCIYEDRRICVRVSDQLSLRDIAVWTPDMGITGWELVLRWSPYEPQSERPQIFRPGGWIAYLERLAAAKSRALLEWRAAE